MNTQDGKKGTVPFSSPEHLLKVDPFGSIWRIGDTVVRNACAAKPWARPLARHLMRREHRALTRLALGSGLDGVPRALQVETGMLTRSWIEAVPMHLAKPRDSAYFRAAARLVRRLHAAGVIHNDLAKETNWLVTPDGRPALVDFQLAMTLRQGRTRKECGRGALARALGLDDIRHLLKHKRTYLPERLTARERRILATPSLINRIWMASGKNVYLFVTRRIFRWRDREGAGDRGAGTGKRGNAAGSKAR
jgi:predicted Ser/Thr protein kinase